MTRFERIKKLTAIELAQYIVDEIDCDICRNTADALEFLQSEEVYDEE